MEVPTRNVFAPTTWSCDLFVKLSNIRLSCIFPDKKGKLKKGCIRDREILPTKINTHIDQIVHLVPPHV